MHEHKDGQYGDKLVMNYPASWWRNMWREALPSGNGVLGASVFGGQSTRRLDELVYP